jgi:hypothetical protein
MKRSSEKVKSLDEEDEEDIKMPQTQIKKTRKGYLNCERATKNGLRCLNMGKYGFKIGPECYQFCGNHIQSTLTKLFELLLLGPNLVILQENFTGNWIRKTIDKYGFNYLLFVNENNEQVGVLRFERGRISFEDETINSIREFVEDYFISLSQQHKMIVIEMGGTIKDHDEMGKFENFVYARDGKGNEIKIPIDDVTKIPGDRFVIEFDIVLDFTQLFRKNAVA